MYTATIKVTSLTEPETIHSSRADKSLTLRWLKATTAHEDKLIAFKVWNELGENKALSPGNEVQVDFIIHCQEHNAKFFSSLTVVKVH